MRIESPALAAHGAPPGARPARAHRISHACRPRCSPPGASAGPCASESPTLAAHGAPPRERGRPVRIESPALAAHGAPWERGRPARKWAEGPPVCSSGRDARAPRRDSVASCSPGLTIHAFPTHRSNSSCWCRGCSAPRPRAPGTGKRRRRSWRGSTSTGSTGFLHVPDTRTDNRPGRRRFPRSARLPLVRARGSTRGRRLAGGRADGARGPGEADEGSGFRLRADPVHLRADIDDLVLFDASDIDLSPDDAVALARTVNDALGPDGPRIDAAHPHRWYVAPDAPARIRDHPALPGRRCAGVRGVAARTGRGAVAPLDERGADGAARVPGQRGAGTPRRGARQQRLGVGSREPSARLAMLRRRSSGCGPTTRCCAVWRATPASRAARIRPARGSGWTATRGPGVHLTVIRRPVPGGEARGRRRVARRTRALQPLMGAAAARRAGSAAPLPEVSIHDERGHRFAATRRGRFRWWRRAGLAARIAGARGPNA